MKSERHTISTIILSAGKSGRFGSPKAFVSFDEEKSFLQKIVAEYYGAGIRRILLVVNPEISEKARSQIQNFANDLIITIVENEFPEKGRFTSIKLGVEAIEKVQTVFIQNIDNPFITSELLCKMMHKSETADYIVPVCNGERGHPILVTGKILDRIKVLDESDVNLRELLKAYHCEEVETSSYEILANINTPQEYERFFSGIEVVVES